MTSGDDDDEEVGDVFEENPPPPPSLRRNNLQKQKTTVFFMLPQEDGGGGAPPSAKSFRILTVKSRRERAELAESLQLATDEGKRKRAALSALFCAFATSVCRMCYVPNVPMMVTPGNPLGFPSTEPVGFATAQAIVLSSSQIGVVVSNLVFGYLAGRIGPRRALLIAMLGQAIFALARYFVRGSFWTYIAMSFVGGLFGSGVAVAGGYLSMLYCENREKADAYIGLCTAMFVLGGGIGGLTTLCFPGGLFLPLVLGACLNILALVHAYMHLLEPDRDHIIIGANNGKSESVNHHPDSVDVRPLMNVIFGALADNIGSIGVFPFALTPVMFEVFSLDLSASGLLPVLTETSYRWIYCTLLLAIVPAALASPFLFKRFGVALSCTVANILTALVITALTLVATVMPATKGSLALYVCILFAGFPLTAISNISTGPMLDRVAPPKKKSMIQGINMAVFDTSYAVFTLVFGLIADKQGNTFVMWICVGVSLLAAMVNLPLAFDGRFGRPIASEEEVTSPGASDINEEAVVGLLEAGKYVPIETQYKVNQARMMAGRPFARSYFGEYSQDSLDMSELSVDDFKYMRDMNDLLLANLHASPEKKAEHVEGIRLARQDVASRADAKKEMGAWLADYLECNGYMAGLETGLENAQLFKGLFVRSFPPLSDGAKDVTVDNIEDLLVKHEIFLNRQMKHYERSEHRKKFAVLGRLKRS